MSRTRLVAYTVTAVFVGLAVALILRVANIPPFVQHPLDGSDDGQPPIIVRDGSVIFEGGDQQNPGKGTVSWTQPDTPPSPKHWKADNTTGFSVNSFTVYIAGILDPANCPQTTMPADSVDIVYTTASNATMGFHVKHEGDGNNTGRDVVHVRAEDKSDLAPLPGSPTYPTLLADANPNGTGTGTGWITTITANLPKGSTITNKPCSQTSPPGNNDLRQLVRITIVPERYSLK